MSLFATKKSRNRQIRKKVVHLEDSEGEENTANQDGEQAEGGDSKQQPSNGAPLTTGTAPKEKVGSISNQ